MIYKPEAQLLAEGFVKEVDVNGVIHWLKPAR
jgi:hypothetical protein